MITDNIYDASTTSQAYLKYCKEIWQEQKLLKEWQEYWIEATHKFLKELGIDKAFSYDRYLNGPDGAHTPGHRINLYLRETDIKIPVYIYVHQGLKPTGKIDYPYIQGSGTFNSGSFRDDKEFSIKLGEYLEYMEDLQNNSKKEE